MKLRLNVQWQWLRHIAAQPFLVAVSIAAIWHSSWSFATTFAGSDPGANAEPFVRIAWFLPGLLLASSIDIGLLVMANQVRRGEGTIAKMLAFAVLCVAMMYAQFLYISVHIPLMTLAPGVRAEWKEQVQWLRDVGIFALPALLPVSMLLHAFSDARLPDWIKQGRKPREEKRKVASVAPAAITVDRPLPTVIPLQAEGKVQKLHTATCKCGWSKDGYASERAAQNALTAHRRRCKVVEAA